MLKKLIHIALIILIAAIGMAQIYDNHLPNRNNELSFSSCENEEHGHSDYSGTHICFLLRRNNQNEYLIPEQYINEYNSQNQLVLAESVKYSENRLASLFSERAPPA